MGLFPIDGKPTQRTSFANNPQVVNMPKKTCNEPVTIVPECHIETFGSRAAVLDAFAGAGGFSLGFQLAGADIVGGIERDAWAAETFSFNHPNAKMLVSDIELVSDNEITRHFGNPSPTIIVGGPPCQGFSVCRRKDAGDPSDPRNSLFEEFLRLGRLLAPQMMVMENVPNLLKARTTSGIPIIDIICQELQALGYHTYFDILQAIDFGIPQIRKRLFVIASTRPLSAPFPDPTHTFSPEQSNMFCLEQTPTLWDAISDLPLINAGEGAPEMDYDKPPVNSYQRTMRGSSRKVFNHTAMKHSKRMVERFAAMKCGESVSDVPEHLRPFARNSNGHTSVKSYDQNNRKMHPERPCHTIPAAFYANFVHPFSNRNFTPREGARLQSFPDWYVFKGKPTVVSQKLLAREERWDEKFLCQYNQIGNAVPPLLGKAVAQNLLNAIEDSSRETPKLRRRA